MMDRKKIIKRFLPDMWYSPVDVLSRGSEVFVWSRVRLQRPVLDIGCGDGTISTKIYTFRHQIDVGLDVNSISCKTASACGLYAKVVCANATNLPFSNGCFKTILSNSTFEHIKRDIKAMAEASRVLATGGVIHITVPLPELHEAFKSYMSVEKLSIFEQRLAHCHYRSRNEWEEILKQNRLRVVEYNTYFSDKSLRHWINLFRLTTYKFFGREVWSYLRDSKFSKFLPTWLISKLTKKITEKHLSTTFISGGLWQYICAVKE